MLSTTLTKRLGANDVPTIKILIRESFMKIRRFRATDTSQLIRLFKETVHKVCCVNYTAEQLAVWAPDEIEEVRWTSRYEASFTVVAEADGIIVGFSNLETNGCVDMLYVHADRQGLGIGNLLLKALEQEARARGVRMLTSDVSITARPFFLEMGFKVHEEYQKEVQGVAFRNTRMFKILIENG